MIRWMLTAAALAVSGLAAAKLPTPVLDDAAKAKAAETAAKTAWQAKVDAFQLCKVQDRIAAKYKSTHPAEARQTAAQVAAAASAPKVTTTPTTTPQGGAATPVAAVSPAPAIPPCGDPGPFAYAPPEQKPLETSGAHSPAATAASPPSVRPESGTMTSGKTGGPAKP